MEGATEILLLHKKTMGMPRVNYSDGIIVGREEEVDEIFQRFIHSALLPSFRGTHKLLLQQMFMICWMTVVAAIRQLSRHRAVQWREWEPKVLGFRQFRLGFWQLFRGCAGEQS